MGFIKEIVNFYNEKINPNFVMYKNGLQVIAKSAWSKAFANGSDFYGYNKTKVSKPYEQLSTVYKAVKLISDSSMQPDLIFKNRATKEKIEDVLLLNLLENPNQLMTWKTFIQAVSGYAALRDEIIIIKTYSEIRRPNDLPIELIPMDPKDFEPIFDNNNNNYKKEMIGWLHKTTRETYTLDEVIYDKGWNPSNPIRGLSPLDVITKEIEISWASLIFNKAFFENSGTPSLALSTPNALNDTQRTRLQEWLDQNFKGASKAFKSILLESGLKAEHLSSAHKDMEFIEQMKQMEVSILGIWRVPKMMFSITENVNYASSREQARIFWEDTLIPHINKIFWALDRGVVLPYRKDIYLDIDLSNIPAFKMVWNAKVDTAIKLKTLGIPLNDINKKLDLGFPEYDWGNDQPDQPQQQSDFIPIEQQPKMLIEDKIEKADVINKNNTRSRRQFLRMHEYIESKFKNKIWSFFNEQRKKVLSIVNKDFGEYRTKAINKDAFNININWNVEDLLLIEKILPYITAAVKAGVQHAENFNIQLRNEQEFKHSISALIQNQTKKITNINDTIRKQLESKITDALSNGIASGQSATMMQEAIQTSVKDIYDMASNRSLLIARTETTGAMNTASLQYYKAAGIEYKEWQSAGDALVRPSHQIDRQIVKMDARFSNGMFAPGDPTADIADLANCRCSLAPSVNAA
jgi:HK97 family phage portal protein